ncbi:hypothetical protein EYV94_18780 [Puteibacter caeruleilacunae]|nr:hypothetical protein EYV94_18780 [Puteibacter caeruleilacunae]
MKHYMVRYCYYCMDNTKFNTIFNLRYNIYRVYMHTIEPWSLNNHQLLIGTSTLEGLNDKNLFKKTTERIGFQVSSEAVKIPVYFYRIHGISGDENDFYDQVYDLNEKLRRLGKLYMRVETNFDSRVDSVIIKMVQHEWEKLENNQNINPKAIVAAIDYCNVLRHFTDQKHKRSILNGIRLFFEDYYTLNEGDVKLHEVKNILIHLVFWSTKYLEPLLREFDYTGDNPKVLYYGQINKREAFFLFFLNRLGCDVIHINTETEGPFVKIDPQNKLSQCAKAMRQLPMRPFPKERISAGMQTEAFVASEELREHLHSEDSMFYRPWQLVDYSVKAMRLISTYDEIGILAKEHALMRHGFEVDHGIVTIPSFFSKVIGVRKDLNKYYDEINKLKKLPKTCFFNSLPISKTVTKLRKVEYYAVCGKDGLIETERLINAGFWPYKHLQIHVQKLIAVAVKDFCCLKGIKRQKRYGVEEQKLIIFTTLMSIDEPLLQLLQLFDYSRQVPKCIIYNNEDNGELIFEDSVLISFLSSVGMDVVVYNPAGHNDIEIYIEESMFNRHHLEEIAFNLPFKSFAVFGKYIK